MALDPKVIAAKLIDEAGLKSFVMDDVLDGIVKAKLDELVLDTDNSLDDALVNMLYPIIRDAVAKYIDEQLAKLG